MVIRLVVAIKGIVDTLRKNEHHCRQHHHNCPYFSSLILFHDLFMAEALVFYALKRYRAVWVTYTTVTYLTSADFSFETPIEEAAHLVVIGKQSLTHVLTVILEISTI